MIRVSAAHSWPLLPMTPLTRPGTVSSSGASGRTMAGDLPPSSRLYRRMRNPHDAAILAPTAVDPVKLTLSTPGWSVSSSPVEAPPLTTLTTPSGSPASSMACVSTPNSSGASGAGLRTTVQPAASAGPSFKAAMNSGVFHGTMATTTPTGTWRTSTVPPVIDGRVAEKGWPGAMAAYARRTPGAGGADLGGGEVGQFALARAERVGQSPQRGAAIGRGGRAPGGQGPTGRGHGGVHLILACDTHGAEHFAGRRGRHFECLGVCTGDPFARDIACRQLACHSVLSFDFFIDVIF